MLIAVSDYVLLAAENMFLPEGVLTCRRHYQDMFRLNFIARLGNSIHKSKVFVSETYICQGHHDLIKLITVRCVH